MIAEVKRCPFCNGHDLTIDRAEVTSNIRCTDCGATGPNAFRTDEQAVKLWNRGLSEDALVVGNRFSNHSQLRKVDLG